MADKLGGHIVVDTLLDLGARRAFGVPGESYLAVLDGFCNAQNFHFVGCRNEGGAAFMAEAWAKLTGEVGLCFVTRGPGATNASIGIHSAMQSSTPMLMFVGQVGLEHQDREAFQEIEYRQMFGPIAKLVIEVTDAGRLREIVARAWSVAISGRQGPVVITLPEDVLSQVVDDARNTRAIRAGVSAPLRRDVELVAQKMGNANKPLLLVGGGGWSNAARSALSDFCAKAPIPVVTAFRSHDLFDNTHPQFLGEAGVGMTPNTQAILKEADAIIALNIRFGEMTTNAFTLLAGNNCDQWIAHVHPSAEEFYKFNQPDLAIQSHPGPFLNELSYALKDAEYRIDDSWVSSRRNGFVSSQQPKPQPGDLDMGGVTAHVQSQMPDDAIITNGAGNFAIWPNKFLQYGPNQRLLAPQSGAMGYGLPAAVAAKIEHPDRCVICFAGDGDFQMNCQELGTALQQGAAPIILVVNNGTYGTIRMHQERQYPERVSGTDIVNPDFATLAHAYGMHGEVVEKTDDFPAAFARAMASETGAVLDLRVSGDAITPSQTIDDIRRNAKG